MRFCAANGSIEQKFSKFPSIFIPATCLEWIGSVTLSQKYDFYKVKNWPSLVKVRWFDGKNLHFSNSVTLCFYSNFFFFLQKKMTMMMTLMTKTINQVLRDKKLKTRPTIDFTKEWNTRKNETKIWSFSNVLLSKDCINVPPTFKKEKERKKSKNWNALWNLNQYVAHPP